MLHCSVALLFIRYTVAECRLVNGREQSLATFIILMFAGLWSALVRSIFNLQKWSPCLRDNTLWQMKLIN